MEEKEVELTILTLKPMDNSELLISPNDLLEEIVINLTELKELWINMKTSHSQTLAH